MSFIRASKFFLPLSAALVVASLALMVYPGPKLSIEFTGGTLMEITLPEDTTKDDVVMALRSFETEEPIENPTVNTTQSDSVLIRLRTLSNDEHVALTEYLEQQIGPFTERQFTTIGPTVGESLRERSLWALAAAAIAIILYVALAFRKIPRKLSPLRFGIVAVLTLLHDVLITIGVFVILSQVTTFEIDTLFITALLTILGYSVNDTIVIFDRIRDNLAQQQKREDFADTTERSLKESVTRSLNTSISTLVMLFALFFLGAESIRWFVLALIVGGIVGTYSSLFVAAPLLVYWRKKKS